MCAIAVVIYHSKSSSGSPSYVSRIKDHVGACVLMTLFLLTDNPLPTLGYVRMYVWVVQPVAQVLPIFLAQFITRRKIMIYFLV